MTVVSEWTGATARALRIARRMSVRRFAEHLGVSARAVEKWEAGGRCIRPRPVNQAALDTSLRLAPPDVRERFRALLAQADLHDVHCPARWPTSASSSFSSAPVCTW